MAAAVPEVCLVAVYRTKGEDRVHYQVSLGQNLHYSITGWLLKQTGWLLKQNNEYIITGASKLRKYLRYILKALNIIHIQLFHSFDKYETHLHVRQHAHHWGYSGK